MDNILEQPQSEIMAEGAESNLIGGNCDRNCDNNSKDIATTNKYDIASSTQDQEAKKEIKQSDCGSKPAFGKFRSADDLYKAYVILESEFTRKCQALVQAKNDDNSNEPSNAYREHAKKVEEYIAVHPLAAKYKAEMLDSLMSSPHDDSNSALQSAYATVLEKYLVEPSEVIKTEEFRQAYVYADKELCDKIVERYVRNLSNNTAPSVLSRGSNSNISLSPKTTPATIKEAGEMAKYIIKKQ